MAGITGKLLHIDLTTKQSRAEELSETTMRKYLGGGALAAHVLLRELRPGVEPLGPDNVLVFMTSVINGLSLSGTNRYTAAAKSPLTVDYINSVTGWNMSIYELMKVGERNNTLARVFNAREGFTPDGDILPQRMHEGIGNGAIKGASIERDECFAARKTYYEMAGWDPRTGTPTTTKLAELGLEVS
ncbi:MAG: hypothetical protein DMD91_27190 [Candidatus Rokuibacteriota bacterium]|nr:MAG: hypothetical protein DMD91_27190 [Candidatus Rokubacteria bacterium]